MSGESEQAEQWMCFRVGEKVARELSGRQVSFPPSSLLQELQALRLVPEPLRPKEQHPAFDLWFRTRLAPEVDAQSVLQKLLDAGLIAVGYITTPKAGGVLTKGWTV